MSIKSSKLYFLKDEPYHILNFAHSTIDNGAIVEQGTYNELANKQGAFAALMEEFGGHHREEDTGEEVEVKVSETDARVPLQRTDTSAQSKAQAHDKSVAKLAAGTGKLEGRLVQQETRNTGTIKRDVYKQYVSAGKGWLTLPLILAATIVTQGTLRLARTRRRM